MDDINVNKQSTVNTLLYSLSNTSILENYSSLCQNDEADGIIAMQCAYWIEGVMLVGILKLKK